MKNKIRSGKTREALWLLASTLGLAVMGLLLQLLGNRLEENIYTDRIIRYWVWVLLITAGVFWFRKGMNAFRSRNPFAFQTVQSALLLAVLIFNIYTVVEEVNWNISLRDWELNGDPAYTEAVLQSRLVGAAADMETVLPDLFWRWESDGVIPALGLGYGLAAVFLYIWLTWIWLWSALGCMGYVWGETCLVLYAGDEVMVEIDIPRLVFQTSLLALAPKVLFPTLAAILGAGIFSGGTLFSLGDVAYLTVFTGEAGIFQLLTMAYLLYLPGIPDPETVCALPEEETAERSEMSEPVQTEACPAAEAPEEPAELPRELTAEDFARAEYSEHPQQWDDEGVMPYFHVPGGWYYMTSGMIQPECMQTGRSVYVGEEDWLRRIDPNTPEKGEYLYWV